MGSKTNVAVGDKFGNRTIIQKAVKPLTLVMGI